MVRSKKNFSLKVVEIPRIDPNIINRKEVREGYFHRVSPDDPPFSSPSPIKDPPRFKSRSSVKSFKNGLFTSKGFSSLGGIFYYRRGGGGGSTFIKRFKLSPK
jgi:hypothetical protein